MPPKLGPARRAPLTSRQIAEALIQSEGKDARDRRMMADVVRRIGKALRQMQDAGMVTLPKSKVKGEYLWALMSK